MSGHKQEHIKQQGYQTHNVCLRVWEGGGGGEYVVKVRIMIKKFKCAYTPVIGIRRTKLGQIQGGGVAEGQPRFDKGGWGVAIIFYF